MPSPTDLRRTPAPPGVAGDATEAVRALARLSRVLERASRELSLSHYRVLSAVAAGEERASRVAERLQLGKPTVSAAVEALCRAGLLLRTQVAGDQRAVSLQLTAEGEQTLARVEAEMVRAVEALFARTPDPASTAQALVWLGAALDELKAGRPPAGGPARA